MPPTAFRSSRLFVEIFFASFFAAMPITQAKVYGWMKADFNAGGMILKAGNFVYLQYEDGNDWVLGNVSKTHVPKSAVEVITTYKYDPALNGKVKQRFLIYMAVPRAFNGETLYTLDRTKFASVGMEVKILEREGNDYIISYADPSADPKSQRALGRLPIKVVDLIEGQTINQTEEKIPPDPDPD